MLPPINILWFKRDLRIQDHEALYQAVSSGKVLAVFCWDKSVWQSSDYSTQHLKFVQECLESLKKELHNIELELFTAFDGIVSVLEAVAKTHRIAGLYSHEETGNLTSYNLDMAVANWCRDKKIVWHQYSQNGVVRGLKSRDTWHKIWVKRMGLAQHPIPNNCFPRFNLADLNNHFLNHACMEKCQPDKLLRQKGGRSAALKLLTSFLNGRASRYKGGISSPISSVDAGSRISPYLAWGVLSMKEVYQVLQMQLDQVRHHPQTYPNKLEVGLKAFESRLHWHCHFMQKLESEPQIEIKNLHSAFDGMRDESYSSPELQVKLQAWVAGKTGWPLVDACMAMLKETGWVNFRMRAMLVSTASYLYWLHWREPGLHLAREFLDYEPGIHWPQVQMQSGTTGINTLRIYNPIKQAMDQDPEGIFVRAWLPALKHVPKTWLFEPWLMTPELQMKYHCLIGVDYPAPLVAIDVAFKQAREKMAAYRKQAALGIETRAIIKRHASRKNKYLKPLSGSKDLKKQFISFDDQQLNLF